MTVETVQELLTSAWPGVRVESAEPLTGGFWATMFKARVSGQPAGVATEVVVRLAPDRAMGAKEAEVQRVAAVQGVLTPQVHASCLDAERDGWWSVMAYAPGQTLITGLDGLPALRQAPTLLRMLPAALAEMMTAIHAIDPQPVTAAVRQAAPEVAWSAIDVMNRLRRGAEALGREDMVRAVDELARRRPDTGTGREVLCHGDLHPFNVLDNQGDLTVLDWTGSIVADPCFDLAYTELLLTNPPLALPGPLAPVAWATGRLFGRRFRAAYAQANPDVSLDSIGWYRALHSVRVLLEVADRRASHGPDAGGHPFTHLEGAAARLISDATGVQVQPVTCV